MTAVLLASSMVLTLVLVAFCAGSETGFLSIRPGRLIHLVREGGVRASVLYSAYLHLGRTTTALLIGNNLASVAYSSASSALASLLFAGSPSAQSAWGAGAAFALLYFGEFAPKLLCSARPLRRMLALTPCWKAFAVVFVPVAAVVQKVIGRIVRKREPGVCVTIDVALKILEDRKDGVKLSELERALIGRILALRAKGKSVSPDELLPGCDFLK